MLHSGRLITVGVSGALAVLLGAMGAHYLKGFVNSGTISADALNGFETGVRYHLIHTVVMLLIVFYQAQHSSNYFNWSYRFFLTGILLFSGSLYFLCTRQLLHADWLRFLGPVTPLGGICLILGWLSLCLAATKKG